MKVLVSEQDGRESVSTVVMADDECAHDLAAEMAMHIIGGWNVTAFTKGEPSLSNIDQIVCVHPSGIVRRYWHRDVNPAIDGKESL